LIDAVCASLAVPLIVQLYGPRSGGCYALVWRVLSLPSILITMAVADTFHSQIAELVRKAPSEVLAFFFRTTKVLVAVAILPCAILLLSSKPMFVWVLGPQWSESGEMAAIIAPWYMSQFVVNPVSRLVLVLSGQETKLIWDVLCLICFPAAFYGAHRAGLDALGAVRLLSTTATVLYIAYFAILVHIILRFHRSVKGIPMVNADVREMFR
jgi:O-antigen/teichoic acid export membrane protein